MAKSSLLAVFRYWIRVSGRALAQTVNFGKAKLLTGAFIAAAAFVVQHKIFQLPTPVEVLTSVGIGYCALLILSFIWYVIRTPADEDSDQAQRISKLNEEVESFQFTPVQEEQRQPLLDRLAALRRRLDEFEQRIPNLVADEDELPTLPAGRGSETRSSQIIETRSAAYGDFEQVVREVNLCFDSGASFSTEIARLRSEFSGVRSVQINIGTSPRTLTDRCGVVRTYVDAFTDRLAVNRERIPADHR